MYRIGGRLRNMDVSPCGVDVGIPPFCYWSSNMDLKNQVMDSVR